VRGKLGQQAGNVHHQSIPALFRKQRVRFISSGHYFKHWQIALVRQIYTKILFNGIDKMWHNNRPLD
jgi:hypothetical protein